jgi:antitoxin Phd
MAGLVPAIHGFIFHFRAECRAMREIRLKDARAMLSSVVDDAVHGKPSIITRHGKPQAVVVGIKEWERLARVPSFGRLLMSAPLSRGDLAERNRTPTRRIKL